MRAPEDPRQVDRRHLLPTNAATSHPSKRRREEDTADDAGSNPPSKCQRSEIPAVGEASRPNSVKRCRSGSAGDDGNATPPKWHFSPQLKKGRRCQEVEQAWRRTIWTCTCPSFFLSRRCRVLTLRRPMSLPPNVVALSHYRRIVQLTPADCHLLRATHECLLRGQPHCRLPNNKHPPSAPSR